MRDGEIPNWLKGLPLAPEYRPTDTEFADPIAYISKIEKEASAFGICKVIPPLPKPSKKYVLFNLNKSLSKCPELGSDAICSSSAKLVSGDGESDGEVRAVFTTRHQELGQSTKRTRGAVQPQQPPAVHKQVWQSGEVYTLEQFELKSKAFARSLVGMVKDISPLVVEAMFWKAASEKPIYVEYANDVPGSGFGEPEGLFRYFHKRRRRRIFRKNSRESFIRKKCVDTLRNPHDDESKDVFDKNNLNLSLETSKASSSSPTLLSDEASRFSRQKSSNSSNEMEGSAGWKLSNSPWNLQVIARSPGSLTRFMPDDIPGVTSPMVYIGMLFSWFAWHVEDHELHSLNFLHTGSPKTWYAVPGDYAFDFEEVIRTQAYGGDVDRLAALTLLGEKTTLLSPEVVVASGIPCCRLVQNPGEFVVTFPRAYHVGFSHGFNCGEAANFGTPEWLKVAKEAAVRRAAMNYLPMLSHQQLLYLLTMSFVSRVPRSLLPGARSSRLRDRQKEERELSVKKAFIEDMLYENNVLTALLGKKSIYHVVLWDPESLPSPSKESQFPSGIATVATTLRENVTHVHSENNNNQKDLVDEMSLYMETVNDLYLDDDDLSCDFQVDSGTLACVACGILGFPFMSVVQPSERASMELLPVDHLFVQDGTGLSKSANTISSSDLDGTLKDSISENLPPVPDSSLPPEDLPIASITKFDKGWNTSCGFLRPRIFCLEHAIQIEELLQSKGGANMLLICHSDYQKIKAHAAAIAVEIGIPFTYNEVPLDSASQEDLNLINLAIDEEDHDECGEEWTSELGINLRYCVKVRKNSRSKQVQHALALGGLFSDTTSTSNFLNLKWRARRSRSKLKLNHPTPLKPCENIHKKDEELGKKLEGSMVRKEEKLIQYSRRNFKSKRACSTGAIAAHGCPETHLLKEVSAATCGDLDKRGGNASENNFCKRSDSAGLGFFASFGKPEMQHEFQMLEATRDVSKNSVSAPVAVSLATATPVVGSTLAQIENQTLKEMNMEGKVCQLGTHDSSKMQHEIKVAEETGEKNEFSFTENCAVSVVIAPQTGEGFEMQKEDAIMEEIDTTDGACDLVTLDNCEGQHNIQADGDVLMNELSDLANSTSSHVADLAVGSSDALLENTVVDKSCMNGEICDHATSYSEVQREIQTTDWSNEEPFSSYVAQINQPTSASMEESSEVPREIRAVEDLCNGVTLFNKVHQEIQITNVTEEESVSDYVTLVNQPTPASMEESSEVPNDTYAAGDMTCSLTLDGKVQQEIQSANGNGEAEPVSSSVSLINQPTPASMVESSRVPIKAHASEDLYNVATLENEVRQEIQTTNGTKEQPVPSFVKPINQPTTPASVGENSVVLRETCAAEDSCNYVSLDNEVKQEIQATNGSNEEPVPRHATAIDLSTPASIGEYSELPGETCTTEDSRNGVTFNVQQETHSMTRSNEEPVAANVTLINQLNVASNEESCEVPSVGCATEDLCNGVSLDNEVQQEIQTTNGSNVEEPISSIVIQHASASIEESSEVSKESCAAEDLRNGGEVCSSQDDRELENIESTVLDPKSTAGKERKRKREMEQKTEKSYNCHGFIKSPCEGLRPRERKDATSRSGNDIGKMVDTTKKVRKASDGSVPHKNKKEKTKGSRRCDLDSCRMSFRTQAELLLHKRNQCPHQGCGKRFSSHKYALLHQRVHDDERPLKCPWKGCTMSFKWAWARTEHLRVHTGERPYHCKVEGCGLSFRFVSDFSRHRRKTGHYVNLPA